MKCPMNHDFLCTQGFVAKIGTVGDFTLRPVVHISVEGASKQLYQETNLVQYGKLGEAETCFAQSPSWLVSKCQRVTVGNMLSACMQICGNFRCICGNTGYMRLSSV